MTTDYETLVGPKALVCHRQIHSEAGGATVHCVVLADGFLVECGSDGYAERRAHELANVVNATNPERFNFRKAAR